MNSLDQRRFVGYLNVKLAAVLLGMLWILGVGCPAYGEAGSTDGIMQIEEIDVLSFEGHRVVRVKSSEALDYSSYPLNDPVGIMLQLPAASLGSNEGVLHIDQDPISEIQAVQKEGTPEPMAEIKIFLKEPTAYRIVADGPYLFVHLESQESPSSELAEAADQQLQTGIETTSAEGESGGDVPVAMGSVLPQVNPFKMPQAERLVDLLVKEQEDGTRVAIIGDGEISNYNAFTIADPQRIVVDVWNVTHAFNTAKVSVESRELARVRIGVHPEKVRLVFDIAEGLPSLPPYSLERGQGKLVLCLGDMAKGGTVEQGLAPEDEALGNSITPGPAMPESSAHTAKPDHRVEGLEGQGPQAGIWELEDSTWQQEANIWEQEDISWEQEDKPWAQEDNTVAADAGDLQESEEQQTAFDESPMGEVSGVAQEVEMTGADSAEAMESATQMTVAPYLESEGTDGDENPQGVLVNPTETPSAEIETAPSESAGIQNSVVEVEDEMTSDTKQDEVAVETVVGEPTEPGESLAVEGSSLMPDFDTTPLVAGQPETEIVSLAQIAEPFQEEEAFVINAGMSPGEVYMGERINLDFQNIDISNVFRLLAEVSDLNIIVSDKVTGTVTMKVKDIPWDQALDLILSTYKLGSVSQGNVIRVAPLADLRAEEQQRRQLEEDRRKERQAKLEDQKLELKKQMDIRHYSREFIEKRIRINYAKASDIVVQIKPFLTDVQIDDLKRKGETIIDERTNTLTVTDYPETIDRIERYIASVDLPTPQVLIETRIVEAAATFARELGVQWGANYSGYSGDIGYAYGEDIGTAAWTARTGNKQNDWISGVNFPEFLVDLPAEAVFGITPAAVGVQVGRIAGDLLNLDLRLSAAEQEGLTKIISRPKVMSMDNVEAVIAQGREIPYTQVNPEGNVSVVWKEALLRATVTPRISPDERVHMRLNITNDDIDPTIRSSTGEPAISKQEATTEVLVRNGETVVIGGIFKETVSRSEGGVPGLKDIPVIDWLFKKKSRSEEKRELLIFMTPFIVTMGS